MVQATKIAPNRTKTVIEVYFSDVTDPRVERTRRHSLLDVLTIALCAVIGGADGWDEMHAYGVSKEDWFRGFLSLPNGIPSGDTFRRVLSALRPKEMQRAFSAWMGDLAERSRGRLIALDGKALRGSFDTASGWAAVSVVNAWSCLNGLSLGHESMADDGDEIGALRRLLEIVDVRGAVVSADCLHGQKATAKAIVERGADYVLGLKGNQPRLHKSVVEHFKEVGLGECQGRTYAAHTTTDKGHGRHEIRRVWCSSAEQVSSAWTGWPSVKTVAMVESERTEREETTVERRYFLSSLKRPSAKRMGKLIRGHWNVENQLHWVLDVAFAEDESRIRTGHGPENMSLLRKVALNLLKQEKKVNKMGIAAKRKATGWSDDYLLLVLSAGIAAI